ncbi:MAG: heme o synthase, partial [Pyrodictiaceae archaeon]
MMLGLAMLNYYFELVKPRQTLLLLVTMYGAYFAAGGRDLATLLWMSIAGFLSIAGTTAMNMVLERDIDSLMPRTASRPIPAGLVKPASAASFSVATYTLGALVGTMVNPVFTLTILLGYFFDILIYTNLVKRSTPLNIVLGGVAGGMPALGGWAAARGAIELGGSLLSLLVMAWIPMHIWFIATYFLEDYRKAGVPMAPVVLGPVRAAYLTEASTIIMIVISWLFV